MMSRSATVLVGLAAVLTAGCAQNGTLTTGSLNPSAIEQEKAKQLAADKAVCASLASQIETLNKEGVSEKIAKAAANKYKMKSKDLAKANALNRANAEFQTRCSNYPPNVAAAPKATKVASNKMAKPPMPAPKSVVQASMTKKKAAAPKKASAAKQTPATEAATTQAVATQAAKTQAVAMPPQQKQPSATAKTAATPEASPEVTVTATATPKASAEKKEEASAEKTVEAQQEFAAPRLTSAPQETVTTTGTP